MALAGHRLDDLAGKVDADAVFPTRPGSNSRGTRSEPFLWLMMLGSPTNST